MEAAVMDRRHSTDSNESSNCSRQGDDVNGSNQVLKTTSPKPPANALQFIKTGPCDLYRKAQEQIKKAEQVKKEKQTMRNDTEEWQSNLDNWKSSRRKMQEHIIERVVEVKKFELEDHERSRRRSKTFSEMMQERGRKSSIKVYDDEAANDFSDLGLSSNSEKVTNGNSSMEESSNSDNDYMEPKEDVKLSNGLDNKPTTQDLNGSGSIFEEKISDDKKAPAVEKEEYTYERAIQNYVNFAETRVKSLSARSIPEEVKTNGNSSVVKEAPPPVPSKPKRSSVAKVDSIFNKAELYRKSVSTTDLTESNKKVLPLPKVDISKRRELFEKSEPEDKPNKIMSRSTVDLNSSKSIKERLSFLEKNSDNKTKSLDRPSPEISVKDRLTSIEKFKRQENHNFKAPKPNDISSTSIKDRLSNLEKSKSSVVKPTSAIDSSTSIKDRLSSLQSACSKEVSKTVVLKPNTDFHEKLNTFQEIEASTEEVYPLSEDTGYGYSSEDLFEAKKSRHYRHRSLDSLDVDDSPVSNETFERVQSYEDLDYCRNYPASSVSGDTDREDSGIHTADVSSTVSQADDFDLHLDSNLSDDIKIAHQQPVAIVSEELKLNPCKSPTNLSENVSYLRCEVSESSPSPRPYSKLDCSSPLPAILENPAEFNSTVDIPVVNTYSPSSSPTHSSHGDVDLLNHFSSYNQADLSSSCDIGAVKPEPRTSIPSDCDVTVIEVCQSFYPPEAKASQPFSTINTQSSNDTQNFNGLDGKDVSNSSDVTLIEIEEISNDTESLSLDKDLLLDDEAAIKSFSELPDQSDIVSTTNQIITMHSRDQSSEDLPPVLPVKIKEPALPENKVECLVLDLSPVSDTDAVFPMSPTTLEPPKEKPPPPPIENSDDDLDAKAGSLRRLDSAKRIKKEIRLQRSSFLGLDGSEDNYIDPELELTRPPDLTALLTEERRLERQLYRQSLCSETDSNQESRDSGVELDNKTSDTWVSHSRTNSDNFGNQSTTSDEDDIMKKEREIIETLEQEERIRKQQLGEKLAMRLRELEAVEKDTLEWQRVYNSVDLNNHVNKSETVTTINQEQEKESFGRDMEKVAASEGMWYDHSSDTESVREPGYLYSPSPPVPPQRNQQGHERHSYERPAFQMAERQAFQPPERQSFQLAERQTFQQPERQTFQQLERQGFQPAPGRMNCMPANRQTMQEVDHQAFQPSERQAFPQSTVQPPPPERPGFQPPPERHHYEKNYQQPVQRQLYTGSLPHVKSQARAHPGTCTLPYRSSYSDLTQTQPNDLKEVHRRSMPELQAMTRRSMPDLQQASSRPVPEHRRPPPPALPAKPNHLSSSPQQTPQPMTRTTKQALSAAPRSRIISNESWQAKRKPKQENCNYQHWLIQEAEHRRITEQQKRQSNGLRPQPPPPTKQFQMQQVQMQQPQAIQQMQQWSGHKPIYTSTPAPPQWTTHSKREKPLPDSIIQTLTQRVQNRKPDSNNNRRRYENVYSQNDSLQEKVLSVSGKKRCSACGEELGRGAAMIIESLQLFYHIDCFKCCVCCMQLGDGMMGTDVRVRNNKLHCHNCYSSDDEVDYTFKILKKS